MKVSRRLLLTLLFLSGCGLGSRSVKGEQLVVGTVTYGGREDSIRRYDRFVQYLEEKMQSLVQLEPAYNESKALERIQAKAWSIVLAPPGLAALAITRHQYAPVLPLQGVSNLRSVIVVKQDSTHRVVNDLMGKPFAIGQFGSTTGYYFPIFNLYGLTLSEFVLCPTPKEVLAAIAEGNAEAGALSMQEFKTLGSQFPNVQFRILLTDPHNVPAGVVLLSPTLDVNWQEALRRLLGEMPSQIADEAEIVPTGALPDYKYMISVVERVNSIFPADQTQDGAALLTRKPVRLFQNASQPLAK